LSDSVRPRRVFTDEFKREAVRLVTERGNVEQTARDLGIHANLIHDWKRRLATVKGRETAFPGHGNAKDPELVRLQRKYARLKEGNEILKKAVGIFSVRPPGDSVRD
jgi:transposase